MRYAKKNYTPMRLARIHAGIDADEAVKRLDLNNVAYLYMIESGSRTAPLAVLAAMSELYDVSTDFLLGLTPIMARPKTLWSPGADSAAILAAMDGGMIVDRTNDTRVKRDLRSSLKKDAEHSDVLDRARNRNVVVSRTLETELVKFRAAYPKGRIELAISNVQASFAHVYAAAKDVEPIAKVAFIHFQRDDVGSVKQAVYECLEQVL